MSEHNELRWRKTDESDALVHCPNHYEQFLFYARTYTTKKGFEFSHTNQLIINLKISPKAPSSRIHYKERAIRQFAEEVITLLKNHLSDDQLLTLVPMPPSKARSHPDYDDRMEQVANKIGEKIKNVMWLPLLYLMESMESYHLKTDLRDVDELYELMQIENLQKLQYQTGSVIAILDDVLTSGAHFTAARQRILEAFPNTDIIGIFWAKAVSPEDFF